MIEFFSERRMFFGKKKNHPDLAFRQLSPTSSADEFATLRNKSKTLPFVVSLKFESGFFQLLILVSSASIQSTSNQQEEPGNEDVFLSTAHLSNQNRQWKNTAPVP